MRDLRPFGLREHIVLDTRDEFALSRLADFDLRPVALSLQRRFPRSAHEVPVWVYEFGRFIALVRLHDGPVPMFSAVVDEVWHELILRTRSYSQFCQETLGRFLHHSVGDEESAPSSSVPFVDFVALYEDHFGSIASCWSLRSLP